MIKFEFWTDLFLLVDANARGTDWLALHSIERLASNCLFAISANEAVRMPLRIQSWNIILHDGAIATIALWCEHVEIIVAAIWLAVTFMEAFLAELLTTLGTKEMLRVPSFVQSGDTFIQNSTVAIGTSWTKQIVVVRFAIRMSVAFEEVSGAQFLIAMIAGEMLWMPSFAQSGDHLTDNRFVACIATSLLCSSYSLTAHVGL